MNFHLATDCRYPFPVICDAPLRPLWVPDVTPFPLLSLENIIVTDVVNIDVEIERVVVTAGDSDVDGDHG